jgi:branched-chain amino acid transport system permease protein
MPSVLVAGLITAGLYSLLGLALVIVFRASRVLNLASGQFFLIGAYLVYWLQVQLHLPWFIAIPGGIALCALLGVGIYRAALYRLTGKPLFVAAIATLAIGYMLTAFVTMVWGTQFRTLPSPLPSHVWHWGANTAITSADIAAVVVTVLVMALFVIFDKFSLAGARMHATAQDPLLASVSGISVSRVHMLGWAIASAVCAIAGIDYAYTTLLTTSAASVGFVVLAAVVIAGFDSVVGVVVGAVAISLLQSWTSVQYTSDAGSAAVFGVLLVVLLIKPTGFFGSRISGRV